jgi:Predicted oxidoreductases of the aldo/keto reductase family
MEKVKEQSKIRNMGFSFHASLLTFRQVLDATRNWDFYQHQLNYIDTEYEAGHVGMKYAADRGLGVIAMEPLRGGFMANLPAGAKTIFKRSDKKRSDVEWAFDYLWDMPEVSMVLSGGNGLRFFEEGQRLFDGKGQRFFDPFALKTITERSGVVAVPVAFFAENRNRIGKCHLRLDFPFPVAEEAGSLGIETEPFRADVVFGREQFPVIVHRAGEGGGCGTRGYADRFLVNDNRFRVAGDKLLGDETTFA